MSTSPKRPLTLDEYLEIEASSDVRHEFLNGEMFAMSGASLEHVAIVLNIGSELRTQLKGRPCRVATNDLRVRVTATGLYTYPDVVVFGGEPRLDGKAPSTLLDPTVLLEVLSESTESYDRGEKAEHYRRIASLREYLLVAQDRVHVEHYLRQESGLWLLGDVEAPDATIDLPSIGCRLSLREVYDRVTFPAVAPGADAAP